MIGIEQDYEKFFKMQNQLDLHILSKRDIEVTSEIFEMRQLAFIDEVAELMNKTRCHKYWSDKPADERAELLEEYVDAWHFIFTIGNDIGVGSDHFGIDVKRNIVEQFATIFQAATNIYTPMGWVMMVALYKGLGQHLGFTDEEVEKAYYKKYEKNCVRQAEGY